MDSVAGYLAVQDHLSRVRGGWIIYTPYAKEGGRVDLAPLPSKPWQLPEVDFVLAIAAEALEVAGPRNRRYDRSAVGDARTVGKDGLCPVPSLCR
jgi:hypothetical protein